MNRATGKLLILFVAQLAVGLIGQTHAQSQAIKIEDVVLECQLPRCEDQDEVGRLISLTDLRIGQALDEEALERAQFYLQETGFFAPDGVQIDVAATPYGTALVKIETIGQIFIRNVEIDPGDALESEIEARVFMRSGQRYTDDPEETQRQKDAIRDLFVRDGYTETAVDIVPVPAGDFLMDLHITVDQGERLDVQRVFLKGHSALTYYQIRNILMGEFGFLRTYRESEFRDGIDEVLEAYRERGYLRARITNRNAVAHPAEGGVDLFVEVREGPRWEFLFEGNQLFTDEELADELPFEELGFIDTSEIENAALGLEGLYQNDGHYFAEVSAAVETREEVNTVTYSVDEGPEAEVVSVAIAGNAELTSFELLDQLTATGFDSDAPGGYLLPGAIEADIRNIEAYYRASGFLWAHVPRWTVVSEDGGRSLHISLFVDEGPRTLVGDVSFRGIGVVSEADLNEELQLTTDAPFSTGSLQADLATVIRLYDRKGFQPDIASTCSAGGAEVPCANYGLPPSCLVWNQESCVDEFRGDLRLQECTRLVSSSECLVPYELADNQLDIEHFVEEGELVRVGEIFIQGNFDTNDAVIRQELPLEEGDPYSSDLLLTGQANIRSLGLFNSVTLRTIGLDAQRGYTRDRVAIVVSLEEQNSRYHELRTGFVGQSTVESDLLVLFENEWAYVDRNILGQAIELRVVPSFSFDLSDVPRVGDREFIGRAEVSLFDPRFYFWDLADRPWELQSSVGYLWDLLSTPTQERDASFSVQVLREFTEAEGLFFSVEGKFSFVQTRTTGEEDFQDALIVQVTPVLTYDRRDSTINPSEGVRTELRLDLAHDFENEAFSKFQLEGSHFIPLSEHFVFAYHLRFGFAMGGLFSLFSFPEDETQPLEERLLLPRSERFTLGGVADVRGFPDNGLGPTSANGVPSFGDVVLNGTLELRFPLVPSIDFYGAYFVDAGQLQADFIDLDTSDFRVATGMGIRWLVLGLIPVVLDYGLVLDRQVGESIGQLHFNVGYSF